jgi:hypothetical protein
MGPRNRAPYPRCRYPGTIAVLCPGNTIVKETFQCGSLLEDVWEEIHSEIAKTKPLFRLQKAGTDHWSTIAIGRSGFSLEMLLTPKNQSIAINLIVKPDGWKDSAFQQLYADKEAIEMEIGGPLQWIPLPDKKSARILLETKIDPRQDSNRQAVSAWFRDKLVLMHKVFKDRVAALQAHEE